MRKENHIGDQLNRWILFRWIRLSLIFILTVPIKIYQWVISPLLPKTCRYVPTCSEYALDALRIHGPVKGLIMGTRRILSCHPWGGQGYDPVPPKGTPLVAIFKSARK